MHRGLHYLQPSGVAAQVQGWSGTRPARRQEIS